jgi:superfamily II helicase
LPGAGGQTIIFTNTKAECDNLITSDCFGQLKTQVLHGDIGQNSRQVTIRQFKEVRMRAILGLGQWEAVISVDAMTLLLKILLLSLLQYYATHGVVKRI